MPYRRFTINEKIVLESKPDAATRPVGQRGTVVGYGGLLFKLSSPSYPHGAYGPSDPHCAQVEWWKLGASWGSTKTSVTASILNTAQVRGKNIVLIDFQEHH